MPCTKTTLTPEEKLRAAVAKVMYGTSDAEIALVLGVSNLGRVNEACKEVLAPLGLTAPGYKAGDVAGGVTYVEQGKPLV